MTAELFKHRKNIIREMIQDEKYVPMRFRDMCFVLGVSGDERDELKEILDSLIEDGLLDMTARGKYIRPENRNVTGFFSGSGRGFGFVRVDQSEEEIFIPPVYVNGAFHKDRVLVRVKQGPESAGKNPEGMVVKILGHEISTLIGTWLPADSGRQGLVVPDDPHIGREISVRGKRIKGAGAGDKVIVKLLDYGSDAKIPEGEITEILGNINDPRTDVTSVLRAFEIEEAFPKAAMREAAAISAHVDGDRILEDHPERQDFRQLLTVTIDGEDARDLDDAISISKVEDENGIRYHLGVHIADVSEYVREGSALDREALNRGTSVYLADRVVPMLPRSLSNGICSLNAGTDRLALSCMISFDGEGNVQDYVITESLIRVDRRLSYHQVQKILDERFETGDYSVSGEGDDRCGHPEEPLDVDKREWEAGEDPSIRDMCFLMAEAAGVLKEKRRRRGSIDFDFPESKIILDDRGYVREIRPYERNTATDIIEDFMLLANETVAEDAWWQEIPFLYRIHEDPDPRRITELGNLIKGFGYNLKAAGDHFHPKEIQKLLFSLEGQAEEALISRFALRSMKKARYSAGSTGHFGLSAKYYTHFTSPIRRYPDLQIHRIIKENLRGELGEKRISHYHEILSEVASVSSSRERRAQEAEREVDKLKKAEYMSRHIGDTFDGVISGLNSRGLFVELENTVEGMIAMTDLADDYYIYDESGCRLVGEEHGREYVLGQKIRVTVVRADKITKTVDFVLSDAF